MQISLITFFVTGLIFSGLAIPLIKRKIKMNSWYGIRIPQTTQSENIWYEVNEIMGKYIFSWGIFISILSLYFILNPTDPDYLMVYILLGILIVGAVLLVVTSYKVANRISLKKYLNRDK
jgi:UDP-N-acetylmuramyl pentapeptide phosphotransferase/UDP-N-acetylglucosamine-1-phosphate transferase